MDNKKIDISRNFLNGIYGNINLKLMKKNKWKTNEMKVFISLIHHMQSNNSINLKLNPKDFDKKLSNENNFEYFNNILGNIKSKNFYMKIDENKYRNYSLFSFLEYDTKGEGITVKFNEDLKEQVLGIKSFMNFKLNDILNLDSYYSIRAYLLLKSSQQRKHYDIDIERFKLLFQIPLTYKNNMIEKRVFEVIKKEVHEVSDIFFIKNGSKAKKVIIKYNFGKVKKEEVEIGETRDISKIKEAILKAKKNIYISKSWNKGTDKLILDLEEDESLEVLKRLYEVKQPVEKLVPFIKAIIKNIKLEEKPTPIIKTPQESPQEIDNSKKVVEPTQEVEESPKLLQEARELYLKETNTIKFNAMHEKIFDSIKKQYLKRVS